MVQKAFARRVAETHEPEQSLDRKIDRSGQAKPGRALERRGAIVSGKNGRYVTDGPFAESKEAIGGYLVLDVETLDKAIAIAQTIPSLAYGGLIEVRPFAEESSLHVPAPGVGRGEKISDGLNLTTLNDQRSTRTMKTQNQDGYMLLFRGNDWIKALSPEEKQKVTDQWMAWFRRLTDDGKAVAGNPLEREGKIVSGKNRVVSD